jgi:hypothetical protein
MRLSVKKSASSDATNSAVLRLKKIENADLGKTVSSAKRSMIVVKASFTITLTATGRSRGATEPRLGAKAPKEVAKGTIPASPRMSDKFPSTLAMANR